MLHCYLLTLANFKSSISAQFLRGKKFTTESEDTFSQNHPHARANRRGAGDIGATWRTAQSLLHNSHKVVYSDAECASLVSTFCQFFVDKVNRSRDIIAVKLQSTVRRLFTARPYLGLTLSSFRPVTTEEVRRLLSAMPSKSSPLDVLPCSLLKSCSDVFAPVIAKLANLSMQTVKFPASYKQAQVTPLLKKAGLLP